MGKKVVGIAFVVCLDLAFVLFMRGDFHSEALSQITEPTTEPPVLIARRSETAQPTASEEISEEIPETGLAKSPEIPIRTRPTSAKISRSAGNVNRTSRKPDLVAEIHGPTFRTFTRKETPEKLSGTVIWIEKATLAQNVRADVHTPQKAIDPPKATNYLAVKIEKKKRSGFARVIPIIRKPYDWLKALALQLK